MDKMNEGKIEFQAGFSYCRNAYGILSILLKARLKIILQLSEIGLNFVNGTSRWHLHKFLVRVSGNFVAPFAVFNSNLYFFNIYWQAGYIDSVFLECPFFGLFSFIGIQP
ncbi:hypothetical protein ACOME3_004253 [Neoechinorhynchus agilis]